MPSTGETRKGFLHTRSPVKGFDAFEHWTPVIQTYAACTPPSASTARSSGIHTGSTQRTTYNSLMYPPYGGTPLIGMHTNAAVTDGQPPGTYYACFIQKNKKNTQNHPTQITRPQKTPTLQKKKINKEAI